MRELDPGEIEQVGRAVYEAIEDVVTDDVIVCDEHGSSLMAGIATQQSAVNADARDAGERFIRSLAYAGYEVRRATR